MQHTTVLAPELRPPAAERLLTTEDICARLRLSRDTVKRVMNDPEEGFPARRKIGRRRYVTLGDLQAWLATKADRTD